MLHLIDQHEPTSDADREAVIEAVQERHGGLSDHGAIVVWRRLDADTRRAYLNIGDNDQEVRDGEQD